MPPDEPWKPRKVAIGGHQLASGLDSQSREKGIRDQVSADFALPAEIRKNVPVARPRENVNRVRPVFQELRKAERFLE